jgi:hypothetical protein
MSSKHLRGDVNYAWPTAEVAGRRFYFKLSKIKYVAYALILKF